MEVRGGGKLARPPPHKRGNRGLCDDGARLKLYTYLDASKERAIYCDTDSVIYIQKCGQPPAVTCGDKLGDMTSLLRSDEYAEEFVSGGPKDYAYKTSKKKTGCEVRGITLNYATAQLVNFDSIRDMIWAPMPQMSST
jgi:hypothetical protein